MNMVRCEMMYSLECNALSFICDRVYFFYSYFVCSFFLLLVFCNFIFIYMLESFFFCVLFCFVFFKFIFCSFYQCQTLDFSFFGFACIRVYRARSTLFSLPNFDSISRQTYKRCVKRLAAIDSRCVRCSYNAQIVYFVRNFLCFCICCCLCMCLCLAAGLCTMLRFNRML